MNNKTHKENQIVFFLSAKLNKIGKARGVLQHIQDENKKPTNINITAEIQQQGSKEKS
jgi:hypothetical protein